MTPLDKAQHDLELAIIKTGPLPGGVIPRAVAEEVVPLIKDRQREWAHAHLGPRAHHFLYLLGILESHYPPEPMSLWVDYEISDALLDHGYDLLACDGQGCERRSRYGGIEELTEVTWLGSPPWRPPSPTSTP